MFHGRNGLFCRREVGGGYGILGKIGNTDLFREVVLGEIGESGGGILSGSL